MQNVGSNLLAILRSSERDLLDVYEFYEPTETDLSPANAVLRVAPTAVNFDSVAYQRQMISRGDVSRFVDGKFNTVSLTLSNVDRTLATFIADAGSLEGYRVRVRTISRSVTDDSLTLFVGRCEKAYEVGNAQVQINAKQDLGAIENQMPWRTFGPKCQVARGFKGIECLAGELLASKSAEYQAATTCNLTHAQCSEYSNLDAIQAQRFNGKNGNFQVSQRRGGAGGSLLGLIGLGNRRVTKQWSSQDDMPWGKPIPFGFGRTQIELIAIQHADTGEYLAGQWVVGEGELSGLLNVHNVSQGWADVFQAYAEHLGKYGTDSSQDPLGFFASAGDKHSHTAYVEATILGENPDTGDPSPTLVAVVLWLKITVWDGDSFTGEGWSDKAPEILRYLLTEPRSLNYNADWIDDASFGKAVAYCDQPLEDDTGADDIYISTDAGVPGTDYHRYRTTGILDTYHFRYLLGLDSDLPASREADVNTFDPASPPEDPEPSTLYRRRFTCNVHIQEKVKVADFVFKALLPSFRGYLVTGADGKLQLRVDKPAPYSLLRNAQVATDTELQIEDAKAWLDEDLPVRFALVGQGLDTSETVEIDTIEYSTAGNAVTLAATGGTASGATLSGGNTSTQASGTVTVASTTASITLDGVTVSYTGGADDTTGTTAGMLSVMINAHTTLNRYLEAEWDVATPTVVTIKSKLGTLNLLTALSEDHDELETVLRIHMPFSSHAFGCLTRANILRDSFDYPLGGRQSSYNRFNLVYYDAPQDFQETEVRENDYDHQTKINKTNDLQIDGSCIDNYHQADRILQGARYRYREGDFFASWATSGLALLLEEGDITAIHHDAMRGYRNTPLRFEEVRITQDHRVAIVGRLYDVSQYPETAGARTMPLTTAVPFSGQTLIDDPDGEALYDTDSSEVFDDFLRDE